MGILRNKVKKNLHVITSGEKMKMTNCFFKKKFINHYAVEKCYLNKDLGNLNSSLI